MPTQQGWLNKAPIDTRGIKVPCRKCLDFVNAHPTIGIDASLVGLQFGYTTKVMIESYMKRYHEQDHVE